MPTRPRRRGGGAPATDRQTLIRELIRKGQSNAREDGICARIPWKHEGWSDTTMERRVGEAILMECGVYRIDREYRDSKGTLCKEISDFFCAKGSGRCTVRPNLKFCRFGVGNIPGYLDHAWDSCTSGRRQCE
jgi:hypothetical protein